MSQERLRTTFLSLSVPLLDSPQKLRSHIESELRLHGEPLRWAITAIDSAQKTAQVEAVVTHSSPSDPL